MRERPYYSITVVWLKSPNNSDKKVLEAMEIFHLSGGEIRKIADQTRETNREQLPVRPPKDSVTWLSPLSVILTLWNITDRLFFSPSSVEGVDLKVNNEG